MSGGGISYPRGYTYPATRAGLFGNIHALRRVTQNGIELDDDNMYRHADHGNWGYNGGGVHRPVGTVSVGSLH